MRVLEISDLEVHERNVNINIVDGYKNKLLSKLQLMRPREAIKKRLSLSAVISETIAITVQWQVQLDWPVRGTNGDNN